MKIVNFQVEKTKRDRIIQKLEKNIACVRLMIPTKDISFWVHSLSYSTNMSNLYLQDDRNENSSKLLKRENLIIKNSLEKVLRYIGYQFNEKISIISLSLQYEEVLLIESQMKEFMKTCELHNDVEYAQLSKKYVKSLNDCIKVNAKEFTTIRKYLMKQAVGR